VLNEEPSEWLEVFLREHHDELVSFRRHLHANPELSSAEHNTTDLIVERLRAGGLNPRVLSSSTGLVCDIGGVDGPLVAVRADIDALAMEDSKDVSYRSKVPGVAHGCGHDVHTSIVLGAGLALARVLGDPERRHRGRVRLVFEPAEETVPGGAVTVIDDGWLKGVDSIFGFHCDPKLDVGSIGLRVGALTSAADMVEITLRGPGGHTARPHLTVDLVAVAGRLAAELPALVRQRGAHLGELLLVFGSLRAGDAANVIPTTAVLRGSLRTPDHEAWDAAGLILADALDELVESTGATVQLSHRPGVPPVVNTAHETHLMAEVIGLTLGPDAVAEAPRSAGGDTFAWYQQHVPGCFARLGVHDPRGGSNHHDLHSGAFDVDERAIEIGVRVMVRTVLAALDHQRSPDDTPEAGR